MTNIAASRIRVDEESKPAKRVGRLTTGQFVRVLFYVAFVVYISFFLVAESAAPGGSISSIPTLF